MALGSEKIINLPNAFTFLRLLFIPVFVWVLLVESNRFWAGWILVCLGTTDWVDGWLARKFGQSTAFGAVFDPTVDRLLFFVSVPVIAIDGSAPLWFCGLALLRELGVAANAAVRWVYSRAIMKVTWAGKAGAFAMMFAFPGFIGASFDWRFQWFCERFNWVFIIPGIFFGFYSLLFEYIPDTYKLFKANSEKTTEAS